MRRAISDGNRRFRRAGTCSATATAGDSPVPSAPPTEKASTIELAPAAGRSTLDIQAGIIDNGAAVKALQHYVDRKCLAKDRSTKLTNTSSLQRAQSIATMLSAVAIPLVIAVIGNSVQQTIAENGIKKDYLAIAINILQEGSEKSHPDMKAWATAVVSEYSPVPFSAGAKEKLGETLSNMAPLPKLPNSARQADLLHCESGCLSYVTDKMATWTLKLSQAGASNGLDLMTTILDESVKMNKELAEAHDKSKVAGDACVAIYEGIRNQP
ncbi:DUF2514 family protein [Pseudomonas sp. SMV7]|uniref:DUF2514 family protein n=1 Tax=Pseudomonas sp. SMV7 TaxID=3390194 RepID=UPI003F838BE5